MSDPISEFFTWAVRDVIFFSGDVQTTTIAVAITSSLCCSLILAVVHVMALIVPSQGKNKEVKRTQSSSNLAPPSSKKSYPPVLIYGGKVHVPCVKCGNFYADEGCRFVTCKECCFSVLSCHIHQKKSQMSKPCDMGKISMDLSKRGMRQCPQRLGFVGTQLTCLNLSDNSLRVLPPEIGCLRGLQKLSLRNNQLNNLPTTLGSLSKLTKFDVSFNCFVTVPDCIGYLVSIHSLDLSHNKLICISPAVAKLKQLHYLDIGSNKLKVLCDDLFRLIHLKYLSVKHNPLHTLPGAIGNLVQLVELDARSCDLTSLPVTIGHCTSLVSLNLDDNRLRNIPPQIGHLCHIGTLSVMNNQLQFLPSMCTFLPDTVTLRVDGNPLLSHAEASFFEESIKPFHCEFPSLKELTAREIVKKNIPNTHTLPATLQNMLTSASYCFRCGGPVIEYFSGKIEFWHLMFGSVDEIPLYQQLCSPHQPQGCG